MMHRICIWQLYKQDKNNSILRGSQNNQDFKCKVRNSSIQEIQMLKIITFNLFKLCDGIWTNSKKVLIIIPLNLGFKIHKLVYTKYQ